MRRHTLLALSLAAGLALPVGFSATALAITDTQRATLGAAAAADAATMQAAIATVLETLAQDRPLAMALDELADALLDLGATDEFKAEFAVALVMAAQALAAADKLPGVTAEAAAEAAAEAVLVKVQGSPSLVAAIVANAADKAAGDVPGGENTAVLGAFVAASTSPRIDMANQVAVQNAVVAVVATVPATASTTEAAAQFGDGGMGAGPNLGGLTLTNPSMGNPGKGGNSQVVGPGPTTSPN